MAESRNSSLYNFSDTKTINDINALHVDNKLYNFSNDIDITGDRLLFILSVLKKKQVELPKLSIDEWKKIICLLRIHGVLPYFYKQITTMPSPVHLPPSEIAEEMKKDYLRTAMGSVVIENVLRDITSAFNRVDIDVLILKGPAFAASLYDNPATRPFTDIDLLVSLEDVPKSIEILKSIGYKQSCEMVCSLDEKRYNQILFVPDSSRKSPNLELHWNNQPFSMMNEQADLKPIFDRAVTINMADFSFKTMHPTDSLCFAASHLIYQHNNELRLIWIIDIAQLCKSLKSPQEWALLQKLSVENLSRIAVEKSILMAKAWTDLRIPEDFEDFCIWPKPLKKETYFYNYQKTRNPISGIQLVLSSNGKSGNIINHLYKHAFPSAQFMRKRYPGLKRWPLFLLYLRHWIYWLTHK